MFKRCLIVIAVFLMLTFIVLCFVSIKQSHKIHRDPKVLMDKFYRYKTQNPEAAKRSLLILLDQDNKYQPALKEISLFYLQKNQNKAALPWLLRLHELLPNNQHYTYRLANTYYKLGEWKLANSLLQTLKKAKNSKFKQQAEIVLAAMNSYLPNYQFGAQLITFAKKISIFKDPISIKPKRSPSKKIPKISHEEQLLNQYYQLKKINSDSAINKLKIINKKYPSNLQALKERGYEAIKHNQTKKAIRYLTKAYKISNEEELAMQLGNLYVCLHQYPIAYQYFQLATKSQNHALALSAENAMTNLSGLQIKALPKPYFAETFFTPFSQSRFGLTVRPFLTRLGIEQNNKYATREYLFLRRTDDNKSQNLGLISQIYEDDVQIEGVGAQISPIANLPIVGFIETGVAYDLVYRNRNRWRGDLRGGVMYYDQFGVKPAYYDKITFGTFYFGDLYADATYFTRYNNNIIGGGRTHQGIRFIQYHSMILNAYLTGRVIVDTKRLFYNNFMEAGPGIAFIPTNRFNFQLRFEHLNGAYLPAGAIPNPYRQYYTNNLVQLLFYVKI